HMLIAGMFLDERARHFARNADSRRLKLGIPQFHKKGSPDGASEPVTPSATAVSKYAQYQRATAAKAHPHFSTLCSALLNIVFFSGILRSAKAASIIAFTLASASSAVP